VAQMLNKHKKNPLNPIHHLRPQWFHFNISGVKMADVKVLERPDVIGSHISAGQSGKKFGIIL
jgi:hypothetical protein